MYILQKEKENEQHSWKYNECIAHINYQLMSSSKNPQLGCSQCLNTYKKEILEQWLRINFTCPLCNHDTFYLVSFNIIYNI